MGKFVNNDCIYQFTFQKFDCRNKLMIKDKDGEVLVLVLPDLPEVLRKPLVQHLQLAFNNRLKFTDSKEAGETGEFEALRFTHYNRYSARV
jgi:hypothetical protein